MGFLTGVWVRGIGNDAKTAVSPTPTPIWVKIQEAVTLGLSAYPTGSPTVWEPLFCVSAGQILRPQQLFNPFIKLVKEFPYFPSPVNFSLPFLPTSGFESRGHGHTAGSVSFIQQRKHCLLCFIFINRNRQIFIIDIFQGLASFWKRSEREDFKLQAIPSLMESLSLAFAA